MFFISPSFLGRVSHILGASRPYEVFLRRKLKIEDRKLAALESAEEQPKAIQNKQTRNG
jgi:hypothetical protein